METKEKIEKLEKIRVYCSKNKFVQFEIRLHLKTFAQGGKDIKRKRSKYIARQLKLGKPLLNISTYTYLKNSVSSDARHYQLGLAFLNGMKYEVVERSTRTDNKPSASYIYKLVKNHVRYAFYPLTENQVVELIQDWINGVEYVGE